MNMEKMREVLADKEFVKGLLELETASEVQAALKEKGLELTEEEILGIRELFAKVEGGEISAEQVKLWAKQAESGELSDEMLEQVAGGIGLGTIGLIVLGVISLVVTILEIDCYIEKKYGCHW